MKRKLILIVSLLSLIIISNTTYAYWAETVEGNSATAQASIVIGSWDTDYDEEWVQGETYEPGDVVLWNGVYYVRNNILPNFNFQPDGFLGWLLWGEQD